tara:strand:+ start:2158 stop:3111 length:954 start_codon:yes stop_codon:yes gene_type:complete
MTRCSCYDTLVVKNLNRWFKEKWVDVSRKDKDGKHPPCGRSKAKTSSKGYPKCRPSVRVSSKTPKTSGEMTSGQKRAATKRKRSKKQGVGGKPTVVKGRDMSHCNCNAPKGFSCKAHCKSKQMKKSIVVKAPRIPRKKGQPANSKKHSDLYTDENPKGTIHGLGFKNPQTARQSVSKIKNSSRSHAHKTQAAIAMEQRAKEMGKSKEASVYRNFIEQQKKKTKQMKKSVLVKSPVSPEAKRHKLEYDKKYESSPERVKYREELNRERRKRGIYGRGGPDMSHTKDHTLVAESPHANRARHFKERGTLKSNDVLVVSR